MAVFFILLLVIVQLAFLVMSRSMVAASVDAAARRNAFVGATTDGEQERVRSEIERAVPGADVLRVEVERSDADVSVVVVYRWVPPGPELFPVELEVRSLRTLVVPP